MVNTFLTHEDFAVSARNLDRARLGKQRVEAYQILNLIEDLKLLSGLLDIPLDPANLRESIKKIYQAEKKLDVFVVVGPDEVFQIDRYLVQVQKIIRVLDGEEVEETRQMTIVNPYPNPISHPPAVRIDGDVVEETSFRPSPHPVKYTGTERIVKLGFANHPAVRMWFQHTDALKAYINAHIDEWVARGYTNNMRRYQVADGYSRPQWTLDPEFHRNHRAALLGKELDRHEKDWYITRDEFTSSGEFAGYIWPEL